MISLSLLLSYMLDSVVQFIHDISDWLEAIGFVTAIITAVKVFCLNKEIKDFQNKHLYQVRIKDYIDALKKSSNTLSKLLNQPEIDIREIKREVSQCLEHCNSLYKKADSYGVKNLRPLIKKMGKLKDKKAHLSFLEKLLGRKPINDEVDQIYSQLNALITEIDHLNKDLKKEIK